MAFVDLHVHSRYSEAPPGWFMRWVEATECYTEPERIYQLAKERGMTFVTLTDHNRIEGALLLKERHPADVFTGCEVTAAFPEDGCEVHVLVYGLNEREFEEIQRLRRDIYALRDYLLERRLAHSVAHATHAVNGLLTVEHLEKLLLLFNVFEGRNGGRSRAHNETWLRVLKNLTPARLEDLRRKHRLEPIGAEPWIKGLTGGSDDHAGVFIGRTYTVAMAETIGDFLESLRARKSLPDGRHNDHQALAFTVGKVAYDLSKARHKADLGPIGGPVSELLFEANPLSPTSKLQLGLFHMLAKKTRKRVHGSFEELMESLWKKHDLPLDARFDYAYTQLSDVADELLDRYVNWFYSCMDEVRAPSKAYLRVLRERGFDGAKLGLFRRGVDLNFFRPDRDGLKFLRQHVGLEEGPTLLYVGRISRDKNLDFLVECYTRLFARRPNLNLLLVGDGPYLEALRAKLRPFPRVIFTGRVRWETLPKFYSAADLFLFPSTADTFGMAVLEAQSCGLPCIVSDVGGPQEIIVDGQSGFVARAGDLADWEAKIERVLSLLEGDQEAYLGLRARARANVLRNFSWDHALAELTGREAEGCDDAYSLRSAQWLMQWATEPVGLGYRPPDPTFLEGDGTDKVAPLEAGIGVAGE